MTHVCHRWRNVALATPRLWTDLCLNSCSKNDVDRCTSTISRAGTSILRLCVLGPWKDREIIEDILVKIFPRIGSLCLNDLDINELCSLEELIKSGAMPPTAPSLQFIGFSYDWEAFPACPPIRLVDVLPHAPNIKSITMNDIIISPAWQGFTSSLSWLQLEMYSPISHDHGITVSDLLLILDRTPCLRLLTLRGVIKEEEEAYGEPESYGPLVDVNLPSLSSFYLFQSSPHIITMLEHMTFPSTCACAFVTAPSDTLPKLAHTIVSKLDLTDSGQGSRTLRAVRFELDYELSDGPQIEMQGWTMSPDVWLPFDLEYGDYADLEVAVKLLSEPFSLFPCGPTPSVPLFSALPLSAVEYLGFSGLRSQYRFKEILSVLQAMSCVRVLEVMDGAAGATILPLLLTLKENASTENPRSLAVRNSHGNKNITGEACSTFNIFSALEHLIITLPRPDRITAEVLKPLCELAEMRRSICRDGVEEDARGIKEIWFKDPEEESDDEDEESGAFYKGNYRPFRAIYGDSSSEEDDEDEDDEDSEDGEDEDKGGHDEGDKGTDVDTKQQAGTKDAADVDEKADKQINVERDMSNEAQEKSASESGVDKAQADGEDDGDEEGRSWRLLTRLPEFQKLQALGVRCVHPDMSKFD